MAESYDKDAITGLGASGRVSSDYTGDISCRPGSTLLIACHTLSSNSPSRAGFVLVIPHAAMTLWGIVERVVSIS